MIDNQKIYIKNFNPYKIDLPLVEVKRNIDNKFFYKAKIFKTDDKKFPLRVLLTGNHNTERFSLSITGSIRKWYFQENSKKDLKLDEFIKCLKKIANILYVDYEVLLKAKVTKLEIGITLSLPPHLRELKNCFISYGHSERKEYNNDTLYFNYQNFKLVIYDKYLEINGIDSVEKKAMMTNVQKKVYNARYFFRFEISIKKMSGTNFSEKYDTIAKILKNWNELAITINEQINAIKFLDALSEDKDFEINTKKQLDRFLIFKSMKEITINDFLSYVKEKVLGNKSRMLNDYINIYNEHIANNTNTKSVLIFELNKGLNKLIN